MAVQVDVCGYGQTCRDCKGKAQVSLRRAPLPADYYCKPCGEQRIEDDHGRYNHVVEVTEAAQALLGEVS